MAGLESKGARSRDELRGHCSRVRWPRFPHLAFGPHPSRPGSEFASSHPVHCQKDVRRVVRRRDRGQRPTATKEPDPKPLRRRGAAAVAGHAGPGFHTWPSGHIPQDTAPNPLLRIRSTAKKTFGEVFGAATGVSDPRLQKIRIRNNGAGGKAATVAGSAGPGFHNWPSGRIPQDTAPKPLLRIRPPAKKTFGETFGAATVAGYAGPGFYTWPSGHIPQDTASNPLFRIRSPAKQTFGEAFGAATVAGSAGPGFHNWPSGHILQDTAPKPLLRIRPPAKKTFGEAFGAATGVSDPRLQKNQIRNNYAGKLTSR